MPEVSDGPFYQRHQTIHSTQDFLWDILSEASDDPLHTGCRMGNSTRGIRRSTPHRMSYGPFYQRHQPIHSTQDVVWAILQEASDDSLHTGCCMGHSTRGIRRSTPHRMSFVLLYQRYKSIHFTQDVGRIDPPKTLDINV
ncbi:hypothetical protein DPMN_072930 [Dreissena polymorpha]|uniref:Uncharacterized protein n=1 Tax=Dreissena polymorpha TaxID=45954 RepID=A0A9D4HD40_DREPO|nr:hypothetical protein DPMN_072930 [Dreissena polymorpha]